MQSISTLEALVARLTLEKEEAAAAAAAAVAAANARADAAEADAAAARADAAAAATATAAATTAVAAATAAMDEERAGRLAAETLVFLAEMRGVAGSSSDDTTTRADVARRGATEPVPGHADAVLAGLPLPARRSVEAAWAAAALRHTAAWAAPPPELAENAHVHPTVERLLEAVVARDLRVWHEALVEDDVPTAKIRPDFTLTHARDVGVSTIGAAVQVEVKLPGFIKDAVTQVCAYLRRRVYKCCCERHARGEPFDDIFALGVATDGNDVVIVRMLSGAPALGGSFVPCAPCPSISTAKLPLLADWGFRAPVDFALRPVPTGFAALAHLCASAAALGDAAPLGSLHADIVWVVDGVPAPRAAAVELKLDDRLGCGGTSDAYALLAGVAPADAVVKVARCLTADVAAGFAAEAHALERLRGAAREGLVPELLGTGARAPAARSSAHGGGAWPLLVLRPRGVPLASWIAAHVASKPRSAARVTRRAAASAVIERVLRALEAAAAAGVVHCDVRPANIVVVGGAAVLVDWGCSVARGAEARGRGVVAYADARVFAATTTSFAARPAQDIAGALYTWIAIACDAGCAAPWLGALPAQPIAQLESTTTVKGVLARRAVWLTAAAARGDLTAAFVAALVAATTGAGADAVDILASARAAIGERAS